MTTLMLEGYLDHAERELLVAGAVQFSGKRKFMRIFM
jgi:hypothetical protein